MSERVQVTPENAQILAGALQALSRYGRGLVRVTSEGIVGGSPPVGRLTCELREEGQVLFVQCQMSGMFMPTPAMPLGFTPSRSHHAVAWFETGDGWVYIEYEQPQLGRGWRRFERVAG